MEGFTTILEVSSSLNAFMDWVWAEVRRMAVSSQASSRIVQWLLQHVDRLSLDRLILELSRHSMELIDSPHGNHVIAMAIELAQPEALIPMVEQMSSQGWCSLAKHRFGCRALIRLLQYHMEHEQIGGLINALETSAVELSEHDFGNFVIQCFLECVHNSRALLNQFIPRIYELAQHRWGSLVIERALWLPFHKTSAIVDALLDAPSPNPFRDVAASRYGSYVAKALADLSREEEVVATQCRELIEKAPAAYWHSSNYREVAQAFGVASPDCLVPAPWFALGTDLAALLPLLRVREQLGSTPQHCRCNVKVVAGPEEGMLRCPCMAEATQYAAAVPGEVDVLELTLQSEIETYSWQYPRSAIPQLLDNLCIPCRDTILAEINRQASELIYKRFGNTVLKEAVKGIQSAALSTGIEQVICLALARSGLCVS